MNLEEVGRLLDSTAGSPGRVSRPNEMIAAQGLVAQDGEVFDLVPEVASRYGRLRNGRGLEIWTPNHRIPTIGPATTLRIIAPEAFILHWTMDDWQSSTDTSLRNIARPAWCRADA
jgi:hypothetical protein